MLVAQDELDQLAVAGAALARTSSVRSRTSARYSSACARSSSGRSPRTARGVSNAS